MKGIKARVHKGLETGSRLVCADNSGAKILEIITVGGYKGKARRRALCGVANIVKVTVKQGDVKIRKHVVSAVIIRQRAEYRRMNGMRIKFEDNAAVIVNENGDPTGTQVKGPVAREVVERFLSIGKICSLIV